MPPVPVAAPGTASALSLAKHKTYPGYQNVRGIARQRLRRELRYATPASKAGSREK